MNESDEKELTGEDARITRVMYGYMSQDALAEQVGVSTSTIQRYEAAEHLDKTMLAFYRYDAKFDIMLARTFFMSLRSKRET